MCLGKKKKVNTLNCGRIVVVILIDCHIEPYCDDRHVQHTIHSVCYEPKVQRDIIRFLQNKVHSFGDAMCLVGQNCYSKMKVENFVLTSDSILTNNKIKVKSFKISDDV